MKKHHRKFLRRAKLIIAFSVVAFIISSSSLCGVFMFYGFVHRAPFLDVERLPPHIEQAVLAFISLVIGIIIALIFRKIILRPLYATYDVLDRIAKGDYSARVKPEGIRSIRTVGKRINLMAEELGSIEIMRNDFVNNFSHEFKTPIISIEGFAKILKDKNLSEAEREEYLNIIISESHRLAELSTNILTLNKLENQSMLTEQKDFNVTEQIRQCVVLLESKWEKKGISFEFEGDDYTVFANENLLQQLWINILDNAIKYSFDGGEIKVNVIKKGKQLIFTFTDHGKGMTENELRHAFDRFYQSDLNHKTDGNGIGLPVAKKICELHEGDITLKATDGGGTTVEITLPY
ncbi:MAG: HAMP domain-containing histidine kinase [Clostridia bacterium]|nr:HAMP domain-containing histidine kinase [Clostridia bacterium]